VKKYPNLPAHYFPLLRKKLVGLQETILKKTPGSDSATFKKQIEYKRERERELNQKHFTLLYKLMALKSVSFIHPLSRKRLELNFQVFSKQWKKRLGLFSLKKDRLNGVTSTPCS